MVSGDASRRAEPSRDTACCLPAQAMAERQVPGEISSGESEGRAAAAAAASQAELTYVSDAEPGIRRRAAGTGFTYLGPGGGKVTDRPTLQRIHDIVVPPAWTDVWICPDPNGHIQATGRDLRQRKPSGGIVGVSQRMTSSVDRLDLGSGLISPHPQSGGGERDGSEEVGGQLVVAGSNPPEMFEFAEEALDEVALAVEAWID